jgi:uncharacterized membrane protein (DUF106 family)
MFDPAVLLVFAILVGGISGYVAAVLYIKNQLQNLDEQALSMRKAARRLESANKMDSARLTVYSGHY